MGCSRDLIVVVERVMQDVTFMNVWCMEGAGNNVFSDSAKIIAAIDELARYCGASFWKFESPRKGWMRVFKDYAKPVRIVYERNINA
jgi:hypothetical protein